MPRPLRKEYRGAKYHVTARGNGRAAIFLGDADCRRFAEQLDAALRKDGVILYAYVMMPNHYHMLVETPRGNLHAFVQRLNTAYSLYWRYAHHKPGHVFQGRYHAKLVSGDQYLLALTRYIHLNPVKGKLGEGLSMAERRRRSERYPWSSCRAYLGQPSEVPPVNLRWLTLMGGRTLGISSLRYRAFMRAALSREDTALREALTSSRYAVGDAGFVTDIEAALKAGKQGDMRDADVLWPPETRPSPIQIDAAICSVYGIGPERLKAHGRTAGEAKSMALEMACAIGGMTQRSAGLYYGGITSAAVGYQRRRLHAMLGADADARSRFERIRAHLKL